MNHARTRAFRRFQAEAHMRRRLSEDRNQHYRNLDCACWSDPRVMARFREQPKHCACWMCRNPRRVFGEPSFQELRAGEAARLDVAGVAQR